MNDNNRRDLADHRYPAQVNQQQQILGVHRRPGVVVQRSPVPLDRPYGDVTIHRSNHQMTSGTQTRVVVVTPLTV